MNRLIRFTRGLGRDDEGQDLIEYALVAVLIAVVAVLTVGLVGNKVSAAWAVIPSALP